MADIKKGSEEAVASGAEVLEKFEKESRTRNFDAKSLVKIVYVLCFLFTVYHLAYASGVRFMQMVNIKHHAIHVGLVLVLGFAMYPAFKKSSRTRIAWYDLSLIHILHPQAENHQPILAGDGDSDLRAERPEIRGLSKQHGRHWAAAQVHRAQGAVFHAGLSGV